MTVNLPKQQKPVTISDIRPADAHAVVALFKRARLAADENLVKGYIAHAIAEGYFEKAVERYMKGGFSPSVLRKAMIGDRFVGFYMVGRADAYPETAHRTQGLVGELHWLYIEPSLKRQGIGTKLFQSAARALCELYYDSVVINAIDGRHDAQAFYKAMGMELWAPRLEKNTRNGVVFDVPCVLMGHQDVQAYVKNLPPAMTGFGRKASACASLDAR